MATAVTVKGQKITRPGTYSEIKSGIKNPSLSLSYGNICIIDDGIGAGYGGGAGISGELTPEPSDTVYAFKTIQDFRDFVKGGVLWDIAEPLFKPAGLNKPLINGVSTIYFIRAAQTTAGTITKTFDNGEIVIKTLDEGLNANGVVTSSNLTKGYGLKLVPGVLDKNKFILKIWVGTYKGGDALNGSYPYDGISELEAKPFLIYQSKEVVTLSELAAWLSDDYDFQQYFRFISLTGTGSIINGDIDSSFILATGATESYTDEAYDKALLQVKNLDNSAFLATKYGADATHLNNFKILDFLLNGAKYEKLLYIPGGYDKTEFDQENTGSSLDTATVFNSDNVVVVHGGCKKSPRNGKGFKVKSQLYKAAIIIGRVSGLPPQTPITLKQIGIDGEVHPLTEDAQEYALSKGILYTYYDFELGAHVIGQGINSLQNNEFLVNEDGTSFSIAVKRIEGQLNKELIFFAKRRFYGSEEGPNRNTISPEDIKAWLEGFLQDRIASTQSDNLITRFGNVTVTTNQDNYFVGYEFVPNFEVSKIVFTGFILEK